MESKLQKKVKEFTRDLEFLDTGIHNLKRAYDLYFSGQMQKQPYELRQRIESIIRRYRNTNIQKTELQFKYAALVSRYNAYCDFWEKVFETGVAPTGVRILAKPLNLTSMVQEETAGSDNT